MCHLFVYISFAIITNMARIRAEHALMRSYEMTGRPETKAVCENLHTLHIGVVKQAVGQMIPYLVLYVVPILWTKHDYALPVVWLAVPTIGYNLAKSADTKQKSTSTKGATGNRTASKLSKAPMSDKGRSNTVDEVQTHVEDESFSFSMSDTRSAVAVSMNPTFKRGGHEATVSTRIAAIRPSAV
jgi:hypothetical protein